ncbi:MAG: SpoIVB peptidase [Bacillota bacterium]|nr:SpoIVB peptidase [Bacillota bacterium]
MVSIEGENLALRTFAPEIDKNFVSVSDTINSGRKFSSEAEGTVKICGVIPIKKVTVETIPAITVIPCGNSVGIKLYTEGVLVISTDNFTDKNGAQCSPALSAGIKPGDMIIAVNGKIINSSDELGKVVNDAGGSEVSLSIRRNSIDEKVNVAPKYSPSSESYKLGVWVRDSCAGIGTLTFYRPDTDKYAALGHGLTDSDTDSIYSVYGGQLVEASILSVNKGKKGIPGELCGIFSDSANPLGSLEKNTVCGISGSLSRHNFTENTACTIAPRSSVNCGEAYILCCISEKKVERYKIEIQRICDNGEDSSKDMLIRVTDERLLKKTGGIVQGMSGSPIIQNGRLIGAVTHVFVNDPTRGYGIFIDKMMREAN